MGYRNNLVPSDAVAVTPSDSTQLNLCGLYVGGTGNVTVITAAGNSVLFSNLPVGAIITLGISKVMSTGTTATALTGYIMSA